MTFHRHKPLYAPRGAVATSQPLAASAGLDVLRRGGNAVDAAVATAIALTVVQPGSNDIGGDLFAIVWDGTRLHGLNASGRSPAALTPDRVPGGMPERGWLPVTVPGAPAGWRDLHARFGALPFADLFTDAIAYAERGFPVSPEIARAWDRSVAQYARLAGEEYAEWGRIFTVGGASHSPRRAPRAGERWANPGAARTLRLIAETCAGAFYTGEVASALAEHAARTGGLVTAADLAAHSSSWVDPIPVSYRGHEVWELPPNGQGVAALVALGILDGVDLAALPPAERLHWQIEAMKLGFADAFEYVADPDRVVVPPPALLAPEYLAARRREIGERAALPEPGEPARGGTVYLCTADADGLMVSLIQSNYMGFGSFVAVPGYGFGLQNRGLGFRPEPDHPNGVGPCRRPFHTIIPGFLTRGGAPVGPFGVMGGHMQPQGHLQVITSTVDGLDPQAALGAPRWYWQSGRAVLVEDGLADAATLSELERRGHEITVGREPSTFGYGQAIWRLPGGGYVAGSEPRADGCAAGY
ncbi:gamma-glutamyltransferase family protein [Phytohabitans suffuscus]|uniref:Gamma-glutamyltranspeptidase n=1 Tax=Phytohabitans suffuscus TaxID=624315 RepID=A0A6F8YHX5_9ACTN|nr:gamma-glutamyltransferase family protein [Phytohabitans suffuscus]BCB85667.1 gamma-glutamyltranspeptidase [Phytohabitans suffuscus]